MVTALAVAGILLVMLVLLQLVVLVFRHPLPLAYRKRDGITASAEFPSAAIVTLSVGFCISAGSAIIAAATVLGAFVARAFAKIGEAPAMGGSRPVAPPVSPDYRHLWLARHQRCRGGGAGT